MNFRLAGRLHGLATAILLCGFQACTLAADLCAPGEATDPQPLHINGSRPFVYKKLGAVDLRLHVFSSAGRKPGTRSPAAVFFFGGGWVIGDLRRFQAQATHLAMRGLVTVLVDYRVTCRYPSTTVVDEVGDAKSAMRWVRGHADELGIDPSRIAAVGSSAGAHLATATALVPGFDDPADPPVDPRPNALVLYNPALDLTAPVALSFITQYQGKAAAGQARAVSPVEYLDRGLPPTVMFQGTSDALVSPAANEDFCRRARALKAQCDVAIYPGAPHGFAEIWLALDDPTLGMNTEKWAADTSARTDAFLERLGWLDGR